MKWTPYSRSKKHNILLSDLAFVATSPPTLLWRHHLHQPQCVRRRSQVESLIVRLPSFVTTPLVDIVRSKCHVEDGHGTTHQKVCIRLSPYVRNALTVTLLALWKTQFGTVALPRSTVNTLKNKFQQVSRQSFELQRCSGYAFDAEFQCSIRIWRTLIHEGVIVVLAKETRLSQNTCIICFSIQNFVQNFLQEIDLERFWELHEYHDR